MLLEQGFANVLVELLVGAADVPWRKQVAARPGHAVGGLSAAGWHEAIAGAITPGPPLITRRRKIACPILFGRHTPAPPGGARIRLCAAAELTLPVVSSSAIAIVAGRAVTAIA